MNKPRLRSGFYVTIYLWWAGLFVYRAAEAVFAGAFALAAVYTFNAILAGLFAAIESTRTG